MTGPGTSRCRAPSRCIPLAGLACRGSGGEDAGGLRALRALGDLELHALVLLQAAEAGAVNLGVVHEDVRSVGAGDEAVALLRVEPLDGSLCHVRSLQGLDTGPRGAVPGPVLDAASPDP